MALTASVVSLYSTILKKREVKEDRKAVPYTTRPAFLIMKNIGSDDLSALPHMIFQSPPRGLITHVLHDYSIATKIQQLLSMMVSAS
jgi:hypothetical protein